MSRIALEACHSCCPAAQTSGSVGDTLPGLIRELYVSIRPTEQSSFRKRLPMPREIRRNALTLHPNAILAEL
jgi:hypothetical protein